MPSCSIYPFPRTFLLCALLLFSCFGSKASDTLNLYRSYDGTLVFHEITSKDTLYKVLYPNGKLDAVCTLRNWQCEGVYRRFYPNGKLMWEKEMKADRFQGISRLYGPDGKLIASFQIQDGRITRTDYLKEGIFLLCGHVESHSKVYGGVEYADGRSNVSEHSGAYKFRKMYAALVDSGKPSLLLGHFKTDFLGDFFILCSKGKIGLFPDEFKISQIKGNMFLEPSRPSSSGHSNWSADVLPVFTEPGLKEIKITYSSVGYAP